MTQEHIVFRALTRPALLAGVPLMFWLVHGCLSLIFFIGTQAWGATLILGALGYGVGYLGSRIEPRFMNVLWGYIQCANCKNRRFWGGNSYDPS